MSRCDDLPATITHVPVPSELVLNTHDDGRLRPKHVECACRNKPCTVLHQVGASFDLSFCVSTKRKSTNEVRVSHVLTFGMPDTSLIATPFDALRSHNVAKTVIMLPTV
jgi:hypothetical protein